MTIQGQLRLLQDISGATQNELALKLGVSFATFNRWLHGKAVPRKGAVESIANLLREMTGDILLPDNVLVAKKMSIQFYHKRHPGVLQNILSSPDIRDQFALSLTYHSNSIEGSTLSEPDTAAILFEGATIPRKTLVEHLEAKNHQAALEYVYDALCKHQVIDQQLICKTHSILMNAILPDAGEYRKHAVRIVGTFVPTANPLSIAKRMTELDAMLSKKTTDVIAQVALVHSTFEQIHPFADGNGRVGRLLMQAMLLKANVAPAVIHQERKRQYSTHLNHAQLKGEYGSLEEVVCDAVLAGYAILERRW